MFQSQLDYQDGDLLCKGYVAYDDQTDSLRPAVLVIHDWSGCNRFAQEKAEKLAELGYLGLALDLYGNGQLGETTEEKIALMSPLANDRALLLKRIRAGLQAVQGLKQVDKSRIAVIGFCFGGLCALDLARSGADLKGVVSFHGLLNRPAGMTMQKIPAKILALHGYDDPMVTPEQVNEFCQEMTQAEADWQVHMYGHTQHAFSNPAAHDHQLGTVYNARAEKRSWQAMVNFLQEVL